MHQDDPIDPAAPDSDDEWKKGKSSASIAFVEEAEDILSRGDGLTTYQIALLKLTVARMKRGVESLLEPETVEEWLFRLENHHP